MAKRSSKKEETVEMGAVLGDAEEMLTAIIGKSTVAKLKSQSRADLLSVLEREFKGLFHAIAVIMPHGERQQQAFYSAMIALEMCKLAGGKDEPQLPAYVLKRSKI